MEWDLEDWQAAFDEYAAILEYDAGMPRLQAEALARQELRKMGAPLGLVKTAKRAA